MSSDDSPLDLLLKNAKPITCAYHPDRLADGFAIGKSGRPVALCEECGPLV